jgi:hypothetical protein
MPVTSSFINSSVNFLVYGNSLLFPREAHYEYKDVFLSLIDLSSHVTAINRGIPASSIIEQRALLERDLGYFSGKAKITVLFLCGIVECTPRPFTYRLRKIIKKIPNKSIKQVPANSIPPQKVKSVLVVQA